MEVKEFSSLKLANDVYPLKISDAKIFENEKGKAWRIDGELSAEGKTYSYTFFVPYDITQKNRHGQLLKAVLSREIINGENFDEINHPTLLRSKTIRVVLEWDNKTERMLVKSILPYKLI